MYIKISYKLNSVCSCGCCFGILIASTRIAVLYDRQFLRPLYISRLLMIDTPVEDNEKNVDT